MSYLVDAEILGLAGKTEPTQISFDRHLSVLYGLNGSGKTSLLKILHSALIGDAGSLRNVPFSRATVRFRSRSHSATYIRTIDRVPAAETVRVPGKAQSTRRAGAIGRALGKPELAWTETIQQEEGLAYGGLTLDVTEEGKSHLASFDHRYLPTTRLYVNAAAQPSLLDLGGWHTLAPALGTGRTVTEETLDKSFAEALEAIWVSYTSDVGRSVRAAQANGLANILKAVMSGGRPTPAVKPKLNLERAYESVRKFLKRQGSPDVLGTFAKFSSRYESDPSLQAVVLDIYTVEQEVDSATEPQRRLEQLIHRLYSGNKKVMFTEKAIIVESGTGERIGLESLSSGEKHLIRMFVECLGAGPNPILIDEPEISVHIDWQRELMALLQSLNHKAQFVAATHSPEIMADIPDERLFSL